MGLPELVIITMICSSVLVVAVILASAIRVVPENQRLSVFRLGRYIGEFGPGLVFLLPAIDRAIKKDVQDQMKQFQGNDPIWGSIGNTLTAVHETGEIELSGEVWNATSKTPIPAGTNVRITRVILEVEKI